MPKKLSKSVRRIAKTTARLVEVQACPGSGKTTAAVARLAHLVKQDPGANIVVLSHTNATTLNLKERGDDAGLDTERVRILTCHAFALSLIRKYFRFVGLDRPPQVLAVKERADLLRTLKARSKPKAPAKRKTTPKGRHLSASLSKRESEQFQRIKKQRGLIDYDDMLRLAGKLVGRLHDTELNVHHLVVDEYQDCVPAQGRLIGQLANRADTTMVLGDRLQMIYGFAGGRYTPLSKVVAKAGIRQAVETRTLNRSHRLSARSAALAMAVARPLGSPLIRTNTKGKWPELLTEPDTSSMAQVVAKKIQKLLAQGVPPDKIALLGRVRSLLRPAAQWLASQGTPVVLSGTGDRSGDVLDVLWLTEKVEELLDFGVGVETGGRTRSARLSADLQAELRERLNELSPDPDLVDDVEDPTVAGAGLRRAPTEANWARFFKELLNITGKGLEHRYQACARAYVRLRGGVNADKVLRNALKNWESLCRKFDSAAEAERHARRMYSKDAVICSTVHAAKGLEWDYVFLIGVTQGVLPDRRAQTKEQQDEERRMLYTGITRAKVKLWLTHSPVKVYGVHQVYDQPSKFLDTDEVRAALRTVPSS